MLHPQEIFIATITLFYYRNEQLGGTEAWLRAPSSHSIPLSNLVILKSKFIFSINFERCEDIYTIILISYEIY